MVIVREKETNLLKYNVSGDCLAIKLEGDLKSWTKYFEQIQFWSEIEFLPHSLSRCTMLRKIPLSVNNIVQCRRGSWKIRFHGKRQKIAFLGLVQIYFVQVGQNILNKFNFGVKFLGPIFQSFFRSRSYFWNFLSTQDPICKFLLILDLNFFICLL